MQARNPPCQNHGFTLLELMVVLVLIGIILSFTVLSVGGGGDRRQMEEETRRLVALINMAREEAILQNREWALRINEKTYFFEAFDHAAKKLLPIKGDKIYRERSIEPYRFSLSIENSQLGLTMAEVKEGEKEENEGVARVNLFPSGEMLPFELKLENETDDLQFLLTGQISGELLIQAPEDE